MSALQTLLSPDLFPLDDGWELVEQPLSAGPEAAPAASVAPAVCPATVPGDVNADLFAAGLLPDPLVGLHYREASARILSRSWWYRLSFATPSARADGTPLPPYAELRLEGLDVHADIWLNDTLLGHHASDFFPFSADVTRLLRHDGAANLLLVRVTTGREIADAHPDDSFPFLSGVPTEADRGYPHRGYRKRVFLRKPAYSWGWDWSPALPTCGITGPVSLRFHEEREVDHVALTTTLSPDRKQAHVHARVEIRSRLSPILTTFGTVRLRLVSPDGRIFETQATDVLLGGGNTAVPLSIEIPDPVLWWPNGSGQQPLHTVETSVEYDGHTVHARPFPWGLRTVECEFRPGIFRFRVNGVPVFLQGGNWVPCDHLVGRTTPERLAFLVDEAATAHFNCLRVWGGGRYELDAFYEACDRRGILVWHDFMSACCALPFNEPDFADLCRREAFYQVRRLQRHPCMLQWCGNNEVGDAHAWNPDVYRNGEPMDPFYFDELPRIVAAESPGTPYLPTSPYGGEDSTQSSKVGDNHHWVVMRPDPAFWSHPEYWNRTDIPLFNSEYGYGGPCSLSSTRQYLGTDIPVLTDAVGHEHTNTFYDIPRVDFSIAEHYGPKPDRSLGEYILLGGLCQGLNLGYSMESLRANDHTWGALFWMYDDSWGENGWTIIDFYLRRKTSYYGVRRALAPRKLLFRRGGEAFGGSPEEVLLLAINATDSPFRAKVHAGYRRFDGSSSASLREIAIDVPARAKGVTVAAFPLPSPDELACGTLMAYPRGDSMEESISWRSARHKDIAYPPATPRIVEAVAEGKDLRVTVETDAFAHAVHFVPGDDLRPDDDFFDLLPGERRTIRIPDAADLADRLAVDFVR